MNEKPKSKWRWRLLRWALTGAAILITLAAIVITEEDVRGKHAWENYKQQAASRGEYLDRFPLTNAIPDDQNFAKAPLFDALWTMKWNEKDKSWETDSGVVDQMNMYPARGDGSWADHAGGDWMRGTLTDLKAWQTYYRTASTNGADNFRVGSQPQTPGADVLLALSKFDPGIEALRQASQRPRARFADYYWNDTKTMSQIMMYLSDVKRCYQVLQLRTEAELAEDQNDQALADLELMLRLNDRLRQEPLLITHLVGLATWNMTMQPIFEGLARHGWSDAQLAELERQIAAEDFLAGYQKAMRGERAFAITAFENMRSGGLRLMPSAFLYQNELALAKLEEQYFLPLADLNRRILSPAALRKVGSLVDSERGHFRPYTMMAWEMTPSISSAVKKFAQGQSAADLALVACALERYRLAHGEFPENLGGLEPQYIEVLPHDVINGEPLHYRRTEGDNYILYSVGWNEKDDGGQIVLTKDHRQVDRKQGDWVWNSGSK